jgi:hypothetical protein
MTENPYVNHLGDGVHIAYKVIENVGEFPQRGHNGELIAVPSGTEGQVPTYQADGTLAPADSSGGGVAIEQLTVSVDTEITGLTGNDNIAWTDSTGNTDSITWAIGTPTEIELAAGTYLVDVAILFTTSLPESAENLILLKIDGVSQTPVIRGYAHATASEVGVINSTRTLVLATAATLVINAQINFDTTASVYQSSAVVLTKIG